MVFSLSCVAMAAGPDEGNRKKADITSGNHWPELLHEAMSIGALGFVVKSEAERDLLRAIRIVMRNEPFVGSGFSLRDPIKPLDT
jgi:hypothetical protein